MFTNFARKPGLSSAVVEFHVVRITPAPEPLISMAAADAPATAVPLLITPILDNLQSQAPVRQLLHFAPSELPEADKMIRGYLRPMLGYRCACFQHCADKVTSHQVAPSLATPGLVGIIADYPSGWVWR